MLWYEGIPKEKLDGYETYHPGSYCNSEPGNPRSRKECHVFGRRNVPSFEPLVEWEEPTDPEPRSNELSEAA